MPQAKKVLQKGPHFREDDCTLPVYLFLLVYVWLKSSQRARLLRPRAVLGSQKYSGDAVGSLCNTVTSCGRDTVGTYLAP